MASASVSGAAGASDLLRSSCSDAHGESFPLRSLARRRLGANFRRGGSDSDSGAAVAAKIRKEKMHDYPWPGSNEIDPRAKRGQIGYLSHFKPLKEKPKPVTLPFEKPLMDLRKKIADVQKMADETGLDLNDQINSLEDKYQLALRDLYAHLTPIQRLSIARHPHRPTFLDHVLNITDKWVELHGDRAGYDDPAIVCGIGSIDGARYMFMGHQKGRNTRENMARNFGMPTPHGYRKALRMMHYADHHGFPIITFIDTPGAFADLKSEEIGQGEAIAQNLRTMFGLKVPVISLVIGEGGSGGALAIGCANKLLMLENSVFYVASPEACAAILWKNSKAAGKAAEKLRITASELCKLKIADGIIPEPLGGAHTDPSWTSRQIKVAILEAMEELSKKETPALLQHRMLKFRHLGGFVEGEPVDPRKKVNMKKREEAPAVPEEQQPQQQQEEVSQQVASNLGEEIEKLKQQILNSSKTPEAASTRTPVLGEMIARLKKEVDQEFAAAAKTTGFVEGMETLRKELAKAGSSSALDSSLKEKIQRLRQEFGKSLLLCPNFDRLNEKLSMLKDAERAKKASEGNYRASSLKQEVNRALKSVMERPDIREKVEILKAEISDAGVVRSSSRVDPDLKQRILKVKREVEVELVKALEALRLSVEAVVAFKGEDENPSENQPDLDHVRHLGEKMEELEDEIGERIRKAIKSRDLDAKLEMLKMEVSRSGTSPDPETKERIERMKQRVKQDLAEAVSSPELMEKFDRLRQEMARRKETASSPAVEASSTLF